MIYLHFNQTGKMQDFCKINIVYTHNLSLSYKDKLWDIQF
nr:MAG TPA: hypothetical protein [Caudoviricetes sp.]DAO80943.1 MAG TPA: hypothetical protein [Caudoviricetes sp.]DAP58781.1 MAG TPA: hypothetical protein [Caudoviricetes sp.]